MNTCLCLFRIEDHCEDKGYPMSVYLSNVWCRVSSNPDGLTKVLQLSSDTTLRCGVDTFLDVRSYCPDLLTSKAFNQSATEVRLPAEFETPSLAAVFNNHVHSNSTYCIEGYISHWDLSAGSCTLKCSTGKMGHYINGDM